MARFSQPQNRLAFQHHALLSQRRTSCPLFKFPLSYCCSLVPHSCPSVPHSCFRLRNETSCSHSTTSGTHTPHAHAHAASHHGTGTTAQNHTTPDTTSYLHSTHT